MNKIKGSLTAPAGFVAAVLICVCISLTGCSSDTALQKIGDSKSVVVTIFPEYDWVMNILGDNPGGIDVKLLLDSGTDLHSYQATADDMMAIANADMFIYVGGESDDWAEDALKTASPDIRVINLLDELGDMAKEEELVEGMESGEEADEDEAPERDEHVWLSLENAGHLCAVIADAIADMDNENEAVYMDNLSDYQSELTELDAKYKDMTAEAETDVLIFGDRFPFRYLCDDYGLSYYAAFAGCSSETEASFETVTFLSQKLDELGLHHVMVLERTDHKIAETIINNTSDKAQDILELDSMQSVTADDIEKGVTYLDLMRKNLEVLCQALD